MQTASVSSVLSPQSSTKSQIRSLDTQFPREHFISFDKQVIPGETNGRAQFSNLTSSILITFLDVNDFEASKTTWNSL